MDKEKPPAPEPGQPWSLVGAAFDPLDDPVKIETKRAYIAARSAGRLIPPDLEDPYEILAPPLARLLGPAAQLLGRWETPGWLRPKPPEGTDPELLEPSRFTRFLDEGGVEEAARDFEDYLSEEALPGRPLVLGVDHGLSASPIRALSRAVGPENLSLVVLDAHLDALGASLRDSLRRGEPPPPGGGVEEPLTCGNFLLKLFEEGTVDPRRTLLIGVADYPGRSFRKRGDRTARAYTEAYLDFERRGVGFLPATRLAGAGAGRLVERAVGALRAPYFYLSIDADVGAGRACRAVRFQDLAGLPEEKLLTVAEALGKSLSRPGAPLLAGLDVMEIDVHLVGRPLPEGGGGDRTAEVLLGMLERILGPICG